MAHYINLKYKMLGMLFGRLQEYERVLKMPPARRENLLKSYYSNHMPDVGNPEGVLLRMVWDYGAACNIVYEGKTIVFMTRQAEVFSEVAEKYTDSLDYKLPFQEVVLQFDIPFKVKYPLQRNTGTSTHVIALLLRQIVMTPEQFAAEVRAFQSELEAYSISDSEITIQSHKSGPEIIQNVLCIVFNDGFVVRYGWQSGVAEETFRDDEYANHGGLSLRYYQNLAIACIGYINCENIYLHREGDVPEAVNAKRERKGKSRLEPYYICRIRGVNYDNPIANGQGTAHSIRYDVRGHFRRLTTGKTIWVRPHQRGLANELYVPKTYLVDKRAQP